MEKRKSWRGSLATWVVAGAIAAAGTAAAAVDNGIVTRGVIRQPGLPAPPPPSASSELTIRIVNEGALVQWLSRLMDTLKPFLKREGVGDVKYKVRVLDHPSVNAATLADGRIYVTKGLLQCVKSDDEVAAVLAHECGHVEARHHAKRGMKQMLMTGLAMLGAAMARADGQGFLGAQLMGMLSTMQYSQKQEFEADRLGFGYLAAAGYNPEGALDFMVRLKDVNEREKEKQKTQDGRKYAYELSPIFQTHPQTDDRIARFRTLLAATPASRPPKVLSYNPLEALNSPLEWATDLPGLPERPVEGSPPGDQLGSGGFDRPGPLPDGWRLRGQGAARVVAGAGLRGACCKLWSSGVGPVSLSSPATTLATLPVGGAVELLVAGPLARSVRVGLELSDGGRVVEVALDVEEVASRGGWSLLRGSMARARSPEAGAAPLRGAVVLTLPAGLRGELWLDEVRFGQPAPRPAQAAPRLSTNLVSNGSFQGALGSPPSGWRAEEGTVVVTAAPEAAGRRPSCALLVPPPGGRRAVLVSEDFDPAPLAGGALLVLDLRGTPDARVFAGVEPLAPTSGAEWSPMGSARASDSWLRFRASSGPAPATSGRARLRIEAAAAKPGALFFLDDVALVPVLKPHAEGSPLR